MPRRVQRTRKAGQPGMPPGAKYVGRGTRWGNPARLVRQGTRWAVHYDGVACGLPEGMARQLAVDAYRAHLAAHPELVAAARRELAGRDLACWCKPTDPYCHVDVLLEAIANPTTASKEPTS